MDSWPTVSSFRGVSGPAAPAVAHSRSRYGARAEGCLWSKVVGPTVDATSAGTWVAPEELWRRSTVATRITPTMAGSGSGGNTARDSTVDALRGLAIATMVAANLASLVLPEPHPFWFRLYGSFAAPTFILLSGMMVSLTWRRHGPLLRRARATLLCPRGSDRPHHLAYPAVHRGRRSLPDRAVAARGSTPLNPRPPLVRWGVPITIFVVTPLLPVGARVHVLSDGDRSLAVNVGRARPDQHPPPLAGRRLVPYLPLARLLAARRVPGTCPLDARFLAAGPHGAGRHGAGRRRRDLVSLPRSSSRPVSSGETFLSADHGLRDHGGRPRPELVRGGLLVRRASARSTAGPGRVLPGHVPPASDSHSLRRKTRSGPRLTFPAIRPSLRGDCDRADPRPPTASNASSSGTVPAAFLMTLAAWRLAATASPAPFRCAIRP